MQNVKKSPIHPPQLQAKENDTESSDVWGFRDTHFSVNNDGHALITGNRYELSGKELPRLLPWIRETLGIALDPKDVHRSHYPTDIPTAVNAPEFLAAIKG